MKSIAQRLGLNEARYRKGEEVPSKYLSGYEGKDRERRIREIEKMKRLAKSGAPSSVLDNVIKTDPKKTSRRSKWTVAYEKQYGDNSGGDIKKIAKETSIPFSILDKVMGRGVQASRTSGRRPGANPYQWGLARVYAFIMKAKHKVGALNHDIDLAKEAGLVKEESVEMNFNNFILDTMNKMERVEDFNDYADREDQKVVQRDNGMESYLKGLADKHEMPVEQSFEYGWLVENDKYSDSEIRNLLFRTKEYAEAVYRLCIALGIPKGEVYLDRQYHPFEGYGFYAVRVLPSAWINRPREMFLLYSVLEDAFDGDAEAAKAFNEDIEMIFSIVEAEAEGEVKPKRKKRRRRKVGVKEFVKAEKDLRNIEKKYDIDMSQGMEAAEKLKKNGKMSEKDFKKYSKDVRTFLRFYSPSNEMIHNPWHDKDGKFTSKDGAIKGKGSYSHAGVRRSTKAKNLPFSDKLCGRTNRGEGALGSKYGIRCRDGKIPSWAKKISKLARRAGQKRARSSMESTTLDLVYSLLESL